MDGRGGPIRRSTSVSCSRVRHPNPRLRNLRTRPARHTWQASATILQPQERGSGRGHHVRGRFLRRYQRREDPTRRCGHDRLAGIYGSRRHQPTKSRRHRRRRARRLPRRGARWRQRLDRHRLGRQRKHDLPDRQLGQHGHGCALLRDQDLQDSQRLKDIRATRRRGRHPGRQGLPRNDHRHLGERFRHERHPHQGQQHNHDRHSRLIDPQRPLT